MIPESWSPWWRRNRTARSRHGGSSGKIRAHILNYTHKMGRREGWREWGRERAWKNWILYMFLDSQSLPPLTQPECNCGPSIQTPKTLRAFLIQATTRQKEQESQRIGKRVEKCRLVDMTWLSCLQTHSNYGYMYKTCTGPNQRKSQHRYGSCYPGHPTSRGAIGTWQLPGEGKSFSWWGSYWLFPRGAVDGYGILF